MIVIFNRCYFRLSVYTNDNIALSNLEIIHRPYSSSHIFPIGKSRRISFLPYESFFSDPFQGFQQQNSSYLKVCISQGDYYNFVVHLYHHQNHPHNGRGTEFKIYYNGSPSSCFYPYHQVNCSIRLVLTMTYGRDMLNRFGPLYCFGCSVLLPHKIWM